VGALSAPHIATVLAFDWENFSATVEPHPHLRLRGLLEVKVFGALSACGEGHRLMF